MVSNAHRRPLIAGNWKMFGLKAQQSEVRALVRWLANARPDCDVVICPPATLLAELRQIGRQRLLKLGGQTCHSAPSGAHTGDVSAEMLADAGAKFVIIGHSERRTNHTETDSIVSGQAKAAWRAGLEPILCIGETATQNSDGVTQSVLEAQLNGSIPGGFVPSPEHRLTIAYEPVWAIGTGKTPTPQDIQAVHAGIRGVLEAKFGALGPQVRVIYGGSVKADNAATILRLPGVDGALVGGASLKVNDFIPILKCCARQSGLGKR